MVRLPGLLGTLVFRPSEQTDVPTSRNPCRASLTKPRDLSAEGHGSHLQRRKKGPEAALTASEPDRTCQQGARPGFPLSKR